MDRNRRRRKAMLRRLAPHVGVRSNVRSHSMRELVSRIEAAIQKNQISPKEGDMDDNESSY